MASLQPDMPSAVSAVRFLLTSSFHLRYYYHIEYCCIPAVLQYVVHVQYRMYGTDSQHTVLSAQHAAVATSTTVDAAAGGAHGRARRNAQVYLGAAAFPYVPEPAAEGARRGAASVRGFTSRWGRGREGSEVRGGGGARDARCPPARGEAEGLSLACRAEAT